MNIIKIIYGVFILWSWIIIPVALAWYFERD